jgi:hypothetical protein
VIPSRLAGSSGDSGDKVGTTDDSDSRVETMGDSKGPVQSTVPEHTDAVGEKLKEIEQTPESTQTASDTQTAGSAQTTGTAQTTDPGPTAALPKSEVPPTGVPRTVSKEPITQAGLSGTDAGE